MARDNTKKNGPAFTKKDFVKQKVLIIWAAVFVVYGFIFYLSCCVEFFKLCRELSPAHIIKSGYNS